MSISQESAATIVCKEIFDGIPDPSDEEVLQFARRLGIDPETEPHLLSLAREGLMAALPEGWNPCYHESSGAWYYYQASTGAATWEHPLDHVYKQLVEQARAGVARPPNARQISVEEDSKTTAKELESHEEASLTKETSSSRESVKQSAKINATPPTRIPTKLTPLKKLEKIDGTRKKDASMQEKHLSKDSKTENPLATNRAARDYTNLRFQDPRFYECPKLLDASPSAVAVDIAAAAAARAQQIDLKEVLKRSESLSPRHEKDWEQLSSKFSSEENIIDIDKLSVATLAKPEKSEKFDKEKHPSQFGQQKELTLSGGGTMFLKSNRSRDTTPSHEAAKLEDFRAVAISDESSNVGSDKLKSILREKQSEDDDRPVDEERKSVRFDIEKEADIKFTYSRSEDDSQSQSQSQSESESDEQNVQMLAMLSSRGTSWIPSSPNSQCLNVETKDGVDGKLDEGVAKSWSSEKPEGSKKNGKVVGKRFVVRNVPETEHRMRFALQDVSEKEHRLQMARDSLSKESLSRESSLDYAYTNKFSKIKNINLVSKSETECSDSDIRRRGRSRVDFSRTEQTDDDGDGDADADGDDTSDLSRMNQDLEVGRKQRNEAATKQEQSKSSEKRKARLGDEHQQVAEALKKSYGDKDEEKLEQTKRKLEESLAEEKKALEKKASYRLEELRREMAEKEEREIGKLIGEMEEAKLENLRKVKAELEICYEKERQEILANLKTELDERKRELLELRNQEMGKLENEHERGLGEEKLAKLSEIELRKQHSERIDATKKELEKDLEELRAQLRAQHKEKIAKMTEEHEKRLEEMARDFKITEDRAEKVHKQRLEEMRANFSREAEKEARKLSERALHDESIEVEMMRFEKRLLQDKYMTLKEKYMKLKNEVRSAIERRNKRKEGYATASETEKSTSTRTRTDRTDRTDRTESSEQNTPLRNTRSSSATTNAKPHEIQTTTSEQSEESHDLDEREPNVQKANSGFQKSATAANAKNVKLDSDDATTASETNANSTAMKKTIANNAPAVVRASTAAAAAAAAAAANAAANANAAVAANAVTDAAANAAVPNNNNNDDNNDNNNMENPVENIRKQLEKLEDLGDQLPSNETAYTLRYPFQDKALANSCSELEFFRHRIHVERDSLKRAREALRHQENAFQARQRAWKLHSAKATLLQSIQEQREISDIEINLHRTKSLMGEKVIHLRHLEQSLERLVNAKKNENDATSTRNDELTLSDMSSVSSGISTTDLATDTFIDKPDHYQESTEIIASLENLNSDIREMWEVLNNRQDADVPPPYLRWLRFHDVTTYSRNLPETFGTANIQSNILSQLTASHPPTRTTQNIVARYGPNSGFTSSVCTVRKSSANLMERTCNLRDWLRQACAEATADRIRSPAASLNLNEKHSAKQQSLADPNARLVDVDSMYLHVFLNQFKKTCFR